MTAVFYKMIRKVLSLFVTAYRSLLIRKFRSFLSVLGIVCGVMAVMVMISTGEGAKKEVLGRIEKMGLMNIYINDKLLSIELQKQVEKRKSYGLSLYDVEYLKSLSFGIREIAAVQNAPLTPVGTGVGIIPIILKCTGNYGRLLGIKIRYGRFISEQDSYNNNQVCVIGGALAGRLGHEGHVGETIRIDDLLYTIIGVLKKDNKELSKTTKVKNQNFNDTIFLPLNIPYNLTKFGNSIEQFSMLSSIVVEVTSRENVEPVAKLINRAMKFSHRNVLDYDIVVPLELLAQAMAAQKTFNLVLAVIAGVSLLVGGIGIMNIMLATVTERKREIGIRRAVGANEKDITYQFLAESSLLTMCGGVIGIVSGFVCVFVIEYLAGWPIEITTASMIIPFMLACVTGIFFGYYPALQAAKMDPIKALRTI
jgi:putative ABC transport system permease protein